MPDQSKSALLTKRDIGGFITKVLNTARMMGEVVGEREQELKRLNRTIGGGKDGSALEAALSVLRDLAVTSLDDEIKLNAAKALKDAVIAIQDSIQVARMKVTALAVDHQQHQDNLMMRLRKMEPEEAEISDEQLMKEYSDAKADH